MNKSDGQIYEEVSRKANPELHEQMDKWIEKFYNSQEELPTEFQQILSDNFWELVKDE